MAHTRARLTPFLPPPGPSLLAGYLRLVQRLYWVGGSTLPVNAPSHQRRPTLTSRPPTLPACTLHAIFAVKLSTQNDEILA